MKAKAVVLVAMGLLILPMSSQATLLARDAAGNAVDLDDPNRTFIYDDVLNVTWLANWNVNGAMNWDDAKIWASNLSYAVGANVIDDWRLPTIVDTGTEGCNEAYSGTDCGYYVQTASGSMVYSELAHLWYVTLGNTAYCTTTAICPQEFWGLSNTGPFQNMQPDIYWSGTEYAPYTSFAWIFDINLGYQSNLGKSNPFYAVAVRPGDVLATSVPEPSTLALLLLGLGGAGAMRRRRPAGGLA